MFFFSEISSGVTANLKNHFIPIVQRVQLKSIYILLPSTSFYLLKFLKTWIFEIWANAAHDSINIGLQSDLKVLK